MTEGSDAESKDPDKVSLAMQHQGVLTRNLASFGRLEENASSDEKQVAEHVVGAPVLSLLAKQVSGHEFTHAVQDPLMSLSLFDEFVGQQPRLHCQRVSARRIVFRGGGAALFDELPDLRPHRFFIFR